MTIGSSNGWSLPPDFAVFDCMICVTFEGQSELE